MYCCKGKIHTFLLTCIGYKKLNWKDSFGIQPGTCHNYAKYHFQNEFKDIQHNSTHREGKFWYRWLHLSTWHNFGKSHKAHRIKSICWQISTVPWFQWTNPALSVGLQMRWSDSWIDGKAFQSLRYLPTLQKLGTGLYHNDTCGDQSNSRERLLMRSIWAQRISGGRRDGLEGRNVCRFCHFLRFLRCFQYRTPLVDRSRAW